VLGCLFGRIHRIGVPGGTYAPSQFITGPTSCGNVVGDLPSLAGVVPLVHQIGNPAVQLISFTRQQFATDGFPDQRVPKLMPPHSVRAPQQTPGARKSRSACRTSFETYAESWLGTRQLTPRTLTSTAS